MWTLLTFHCEVPPPTMFFTSVMSFYTVLEGRNVRSCGFISLDDSSLSDY